MTDDTERALPPGDLFAQMRDLHLMAWKHPHRIPKQLAAGENDPNIAMAHGLRPLHLAASSPMPKALEALTALLDAGADPNLIDELGAPPLFWAVRWGEAEIVSKLIPCTEAAASRLDNWARGIVHWWAMGSDDEGEASEQLLREAGADFTRLDGIGAAPIHWAAALGGRIERLLAFDPSMAQLEDERGYLPIHYAAGAGITLAACGPLIAAGADPHQAAGQFRPDEMVPDTMKAEWHELVGDQPDSAQPPTPE